MAKKLKIYKDETDLFELMKIVWNGKWKIAVAVVISFIALTGYQSTKKNNFIFITEIAPITTAAINEYFILNNLSSRIHNETHISNEIKDNTENELNFQEITKLKLLNLYLESLREKKLFEKAIRKFNIIDASQYSDNERYNEEVIKLASSIKIKTPSNFNNKNGNLEVSYHTINFEHNDIEKWKKILIYVDKLTNQYVKHTLVEDFNAILTLYINLRKYNIDYLKQKKNNSLEDLTVEINNLWIDYDRSTSDRLAYLKEQSEIARELGIENSTIEAQTFTTQSGLLTNIQTSTPFYLRGFKAINKEIDLIISRTNKKAFIKDLVDLEKSIRKIKQDKRVERIENDKSLEIFKKIIQSSPLGDNTDFFAASPKILATDVVNKRNNKLTILLTTMIGLIIGLFYVVISDKIKFHNSYRKKKIN
jgi:LPS O-antigen subunit length determinant protein (WzzB/FepE family)